MGNLVLTRRIGERVMMNIDSQLIIATILDANESGIKLGINAPKNITVDREEVYLRRKRDGEKKHVV